jgi:hypothetical protein
MSYAFEKGKTYFASPTMRGAEKKIVACINRRGHTATFCFVGKVKRMDVDHFDGRETVKFRADDGLDYFVSASTEVDFDHVAEVMELLGR